MRQALHNLLAAPAAAAWALGWSPALPAAASLLVASHLAVLKVPGLGLDAAAPIRIGDGLAARGAAVAAAGCPFGAAAALPFQHYLSTGVVSNVLTARNSLALLLADVRCLPGMEGGPVWAGGAAGGRLLGLLAPPLRAPAVHAEMSVVLPVRAVLAAVEAAVAGVGSRAQQGLHTLAASGGEPAGALQRALGAIVAVSAGGSWASGVVVTPHGHVLTNAHAVAPAGSALQRSPVAAHAPTPPPLAPVRVLVGRGAGAQWLPARVVHCFCGPLDLAVLQLAGPAAAAACPPPAALAAGPPGEGRGVVVAGHPLWRPASSSGLQGALVTGGSVAQVRR